jgi:hypothetical protein
MPTLLLVLNNCVKNGKDNISCPYAKSARTPRSGYAVDYFCTLSPDPKSIHGFKITSGYVEWDHEINPIPEWCPLVSIEEKTLIKLES